MDHSYGCSSEYWGKGWYQILKDPLWNSAHICLAVRNSTCEQYWVKWASFPKCFPCISWKCFHPKWGISELAYQSFPPTAASTGRWPKYTECRILGCCVQRKQIQPKITGTLKSCKLDIKDMTQTVPWQSEKGWGQLEIGKNRQIYSQGSSSPSVEGKGTFEARSKELRVKHTTWMRKK